MEIGREVGGQPVERVMEVNVKKFQDGLR